MYIHKNHMLSVYAGINGQIASQAFTQNELRWKMVELEKLLISVSTKNNIYANQQITCNLCQRVDINIHDKSFCMRYATSMTDCNITQLLSCQTSNFKPDWFLSLLFYTSLCHFLSIIFVALIGSGNLGDTERKCIRCNGLIEKRKVHWSLNRFE